MTRTDIPGLPYLVAYRKKLLVELSFLYVPRLYQHLPLCCIWHRIHGVSKWICGIDWYYRTSYAQYV